LVVTDSGITISRRQESQHQLSTISSVVTFIYDNK
jgi:hypothetical protein